MIGLGCKVLAFDLIANKEMEALGVQYHPLIKCIAGRYYFHPLPIE
jgi:D-lactate dehydrogenase